MKPESMKMSSRLIDNMYGYRTDHIKIDGEWYLQKPIMYKPLKKRLAWCFEILKGLAVAVHWKEDELSKK